LIGSATDDLLINQVILLPQLSENEDSTGEACSSESPDETRENKSGKVLYHFNSTSSIFELFQIQLSMLLIRLANVFQLN
jgi:hypothetical protein